ncbi:MAG: hypothetical protein GY742_06765 [Hyphomicrobiales bacterium]|nr:hypothetical protein [Hyphomicrobiales bacterium]
MHHIDEQTQTKLAIAEHLYFDSVLNFFAHGYSGLRPASTGAAHRRRSLFAPDCMIILKVFCHIAIYGTSLVDCCFGGMLASDGMALSSFGSPPGILHGDKIMWSTNPGNLAKSSMVQVCVKNA